MTVKTALVAISAVVATLLAPVGAASPAAADAGTVSIWHDPLDFGTINPGGSKLDFVTVTNNSAGSVRVTDDNIDAIPAPFVSSQEDNGGAMRDKVCYAHDAVQGFVNPLVPPGGTCRLYYRFSPAAEGDFTADSPISVYEELGSPIDHATVHLQGTGAAGNPATQGSFTMTPTTLSFGKVELGQTSPTQQTVITNTSNGNVQVHILTHSTEVGFDRPLDNDDCQDGSTSLVLAPGDSCPFTFRFRPVKKGTVSAPVKIFVSPAVGTPGERDVYESDTALATKTLTVKGNGRLPKYKLSTSALAFGEVELGSSKTLPLVVSNFATQRLTFDLHVLAAVDGTYEVLRGTPNGDRCMVNGPDRWLTVAPEHTCTMEVRFTPTVADTSKAKLQLDVHWVEPGTETYAYSADPGTFIVKKPVKATGSGVPQTITVAPAKVDFGTVVLGTGHAATRDVTVTNAGPSTLQVHADPLASPYGVDMSGDPGDCLYFTDVALVLGPGDSCTVHLVYAPAAEGPSGATLKLWVSLSAAPAGTVDHYSSSTELGAKTLPLSGAAKPATFTGPTSFAFGSVKYGASTTKVAKVKNTSTVPLAFELTSPGYPFTPVGSEDGTSCMSGTPGRYLVVAPGKSCKLHLEVTPFTVGKTQATLSLAAHDVDPGASGYDSAGIGDVLETQAPIAKVKVQAPKITMTPTSYDFGTITYGDSSSITSIVTNNTATALAYELSSPDPAFHVVQGSDGHNCMGDGDLMLIVHVGESCRLTVVYTPAAAGAAGADLTLQVHYALADASGYWADMFVGAVVATKTVPAKGLAEVPSYTLTPSKFSFGSVGYATFPTIDATVKNTSDISVAYELRSTSDKFVVLKGAAAAACMDSGSLLLVVHPGQSCTVTLGLTADEIGSFSGGVHLDVHYALDQADGYQGMGVGGVLLTDPVPSSGTVVAPTYTTTRTSYAFGDVTYPKYRELTATVKNTSTISVAYELVSPSPDFRVVKGSGGGNCMGDGELFLVVHPGESCDLTVYYVAPSVVATSSASLTLAVHYALGAATGYWGSMAVGSVIVTKAVPASASSVAPTWTMSPTSYSFGTITYGASKTILATMKNTSDTPVGFELTSANPAFTPRRASNGTSCMGDGTTLLVVNPGQTCKLALRYEPLSVGSDAATVTLQVHSAVPGAAGYQGMGMGFTVVSKGIHATGKAAAPAFSTSASSLSFGRVPVGSSKLLGFTVTNTSGADLAFDLTSPSSLFRVVRGNPDGHTCMSADPDELLVVAPRTKCLLRVRYTPDAAVASSAVLQLRVHHTDAPAGSYVADDAVPEVVAVKSIKASGTGTP